jgi:hypothetical protein
MFQLEDVILTLYLWRVKAIVMLIKLWYRPAVNAFAFTVKEVMLSLLPF